MPLFSFEHLRLLCRHAEKDYPSECCGLLIAEQSRPLEVLRTVPLVNVQDKYHAKFPEEFPRNSRTAYFLEPRDLLEAEKENRKKGHVIWGVYHSHIDAEAYFSDEDKRLALSDGTPIFPGMRYLVISVFQGKATQYRVYAWDAGAKDFVEIDQGAFS